MFRTLAICFVLCGLYKGLSAQDTQFSQFYANPLYINPALAGKDICPRVHLNYRNQWPAMGKAFTTYSASYNQYAEKLSGGIGALATMHQAGEGAFTNINAGLIYAYKFAVTREFSVSAGLQASYIQNSINSGKLTFGDMIDPRYGFVNSTSDAVPGGVKYNPDFSSGVIGYTEKIYGGVAVHHLLQPNMALSGTDPLSRKYTVHGGYIYSITPYNRRTLEYHTISVNILLQQQKNLRNINTGFYYTKTPLVIGLWYRRSTKFTDALILLAGIDKKFYTFGYSYDFTLSKIANLTGGSHEISLALHLNCPEKKQKILQIHCPTF